MSFDTPTADFQRLRQGLSGAESARQPHGEVEDAAFEIAGAFLHLAGIIQDRQHVSEAEGQQADHDQHRDHEHLAEQQDRDDERHQEGADRNLDLKQDPGSDEIPDVVAVSPGGLVLHLVVIMLHADPLDHSDRQEDQQEDRRENQQVDTDLLQD